MNRSTFIIGLLAACTGSDEDGGQPVVGPPVVEDTSSTSSTADTAVTWGTGVVAATGLADSAVEDTNDTFRGIIPGTPEPETDSDTALPEETGTTCAFNEIKDCNNVCYPSYFVGDGNCDDGTAFASDFDCDAYYRDMGDCIEDTGAVPVSSCPLLLTFHTEAWASEIGFSITDAAGNQVLGAGAGFLGSNYATFEFPIWLESGEYTFEMTDSYGDGWHGGYVELIDPFTATVVGGGSSEGTISYGSSGTFDFDFTCNPSATLPPSQCSMVTLTIDTHSMVGNFADEIGWELLDAQGNVIDSADYGTYTENTSTGNTWDLDDGLYTFRMMDEYTNGWDGATYTIVDGRSLTLQDGTKSNNAETQDVLFQVACNSTYEVPPILVDCNQLDLRVEAAAGASEIGMSIHQIHDGAIGSFAPGTLADPFWGTYTSLFDELDPGWTSPWTSTDYTVLLFDEPADGSTPNGWGDSYAELYNLTTDEVYRTWGPGTSGGLNSYEFTLMCTNELVPPEPAVSTVCEEDTVVDCDGVCWPSSYFGDDFCDDGVQSAANFACADLDWDDGDCEAP